MQALASRLTELQRAANAESQARLAVTKSPQYLKLDEQIQEMIRQRDAMLDGITDSTTALQQAKAEMMLAMREQGLTAYENVTAKFKEKREVNRRRLMEVIDGDMDLYFTLSNVTQVAVKDFARSSDKKKDLLDCIEVVGREIVDVEVALPMPDGRDDLPERPDAPDFADTLAHEAGQ